jgi:hypothetical protein
MKNRWSDAARTAALAVRQARTLAGKPVKGVAKPKKALSVHRSSPRVYAGGTPDFDERSGKRVPEKEVWIPPPDDPHWQDPKFVESFKRGIAERKKAGLATPSIPKPNIFYSSTYPNGPGQEGVQGIIRYDPKDPDLATRLGYDTGSGSRKKTVPQRSRVVIGGKVYIRSGNKLIPYR